ncbi:hypothetical protein AVEN_232221-1 [Araneus ventricosus]|uniref:NtA domain-containing protein n=1 Tax=Araneus ventricosus TaxID=182803 RepID=A0A4Y2K0B8_ARAVE|nr:hypothetical protein AVEN_232221-1 [Araneus ventricosus]
MDQSASMVFTGTVEKIYRSRSATYRGVVKVKRVVKGDTTFADNTVIVEGFGDPNICHSDVRERDTRIFMVSLLDNGHLRLNSSVVRVTVSNLDKAVAAVKGSRWPSGKVLALGRRVPLVRDPDFTEDPPCTGPVAR